MKKQFIALFLIFAFFGVSGFIQAEENWPHWRGPLHNGISDAMNLPMTWSQTGRDIHCLCREGIQASCDK
jgi:hypothetical protein